MSRSTVLVTGGAGYVGSHACKALASAGHNVVVVDNLSRGRLSRVQWGPCEQADITDAHALSAVFAKHRPDAVLHFAALTDAGESVSRPDVYYRNNLIGTCTLLETMAQFHCQKLVFSSSAAVYGLARILPINEQHPTDPINPYGRTKWMAEQIIRDQCAAYGMEAVCLRYFNAIGLDPEGQIDDDFARGRNLVPLVFQALGRGEREFGVFGHDYDTPDGTCIRDYVHVADLATAHVSALEYLQAGGRTDSFNLGTGTGYSVLEVLRGIEDVTGHTMRPLLRDRREGDPPLVICDPRKAASMLNWTAKYTVVTDSIDHMWSGLQRANSTSARRAA